MTFCHSAMKARLAGTDTSAPGVAAPKAVPSNHGQILRHGWAHCVGGELAPALATPLFFGVGSDRARMDGDR